MSVSSLTLVSVKSISQIDSIWVLFCSILVIFMTVPGLALFYGGMVRRKNVISVLMKSFTICAVVTVLWELVGYSLAFSDYSQFIGGFSKSVLYSHRLLMENANGMISVYQGHQNIPEGVFIISSMSFAIIAPALITGGFAERMKFISCILFSILWSLTVYTPIAHMIWHQNGWLAMSGMLDFAGGTVVHITSGVAGLISAIILGKRDAVKYAVVIVPYT